MKKICIVAAVAALISLSAVAGDEDACLDCHVPAEDWEGMTVEEVFAAAMDMSIKRHADNADLDPEQLRKIIAALLESS